MAIVAIFVDSQRGEPGKLMASCSLWEKEEEETQKSEKKT
jgi:hypothetical protein